MLLSEFEHALIYGYLKVHEMEVKAYEFLIMTSNPQFETILIDDKYSKQTAEK